MVLEILGAVKLLWEVIKMARELAAFIEANKTEAWFQESAKVFTELRSAKTPEAKKDVAKKLRDLWSGI